MWRIILVVLALLSFSPLISAQESATDNKVNKDVSKMVLRVNSRDKMMVCRDNMQRRMHQYRHQNMIKRNQMHMQRRMQMNNQRRIMRQQRIRQQRLQQQRLQRQMHRQGAMYGG